MLNATPELAEEMKLKTQKGCRRLLGIIGLIVAILVLFFGCPELIFPDKIKGNLVDVIYSKEKPDSDKVTAWISSK